ncbi:MAG: hypothetical protein WC640_03995 [Candidatus Paceibacterota bacterium]|jgi:hypothetical protein
MKKNILVIVIVILIIIVGGIYYWTQSKTTAGTQPVVAGAAQNPAAAAASEAQVKALLVKLQKHIILPTDEVPQIGQIDDPVQAAKAQPFVAGAQKGDLLIVYVKARKAIVYSPSRDIIVNVGPVSVSPDQTAATTTPTNVSTKK